MARKARTTAKARGTRDDAPPDPAKEAQRRAREEFEQRMTAEAQARREAWAARAEGWASDWAAGGRKQAERDAAERRRKHEEEERKKRAKEQRRRQQAQARQERREAKAREEQQRAEVERRRKFEEADRERRMDAEAIERRHRERAKQYARDSAYIAYLWSIHAHDSIVAELLRTTRLLADPDYGIGDRKVFHQHTPPPGSEPRIFRYDDGPDPFAVLGLAPGASRDEVKGAYRKLALAHHPDRCGGDDREFIRIKDAYDRCLGLCA